MALTVKGGAAPPPSKGPQSAGNAVAEAYARLEKKKGNKGRGADTAADAVADLLNEVVQEEGDTESEVAAAKEMVDEVKMSPPEGTPSEQAEAIAEQLKEKIESTRGQRAHLAQKIQKAFGDLSE